MKINIAPYNPNWPGEFMDESKILHDSIDDNSIKIEHIGSTAVIGLGAKPIIDIMIGLDSFKNVEKYIRSLKEVGYQYHPKYEDLMPHRRYFTKTNNGIKTHHIHMVQTNSEFWKRHLLFRDHLRDNPGDKQKYLDLKLSLAQREWKDGNEYAAAKTDFIREIERKAAG